MTNYLILGHVVEDIMPDGSRELGGTAYCATVSEALGNTTRLVTSTNADTSSLHNIAIHNKPTKQSTVHINTYIDGARHDKWLSSASRLASYDVPWDWEKAADIVHLSPMGQEFSPMFAEYFRPQFVGMTIQGWMRGKDREDNITLKINDDLLDSLQYADAVILSLEDCKGDKALRDEILKRSRVGVETIGKEGCIIHHNGRTTKVSTKPIQEVDPTGAGDTFAVAFFTKFYQTGDLFRSARFANLIAGLSVTATGIQELREVLQHAS